MYIYICIYIYICVCMYPHGGKRMMSSKLPGWPCGSHLGGPEHPAAMGKNRGGYTNNVPFKRLKGVPQTIGKP